VKVQVEDVLKHFPAHDMLAIATALANGARIESTRVGNQRYYRLAFDQGGRRRRKYIPADVARKLLRRESPHV
jgi:hypothetical protein